MLKRKIFILAALLTASITLNGCSFDIFPPEDNQPEEQVTPGPEEHITFESAEISPKTVSIQAGDTYQLNVRTYPQNANENGIVWESRDESVATINQEGVITGIKAGTSKICVYGAETDKLLGSRIVTVTAKIIPTPEIAYENTLSKTTLQHNYKDYSKKSAYGAIDYCPTVGEANILVIPLWFKDSDTFIADSNRETIRKDIEKAYFGKNYDTGWRTVKSYYEEESKGRLTLNGVVSKWREVDYSYADAGTSTFIEGQDFTSYMVRTSIDWFLSQPEYSSLYTKQSFDKDGDGYLDGVMLIYAAPDYVSLYKSEYQNLWAYCSWLGTDSNVSAPNANAFFWASYDFMYSRGDYALLKTGLTRYGHGDTSRMKIDSHTFIHEMGHVFGLDDYYDYSGQFSPAGGFSMQDNNVGGHDPFSLMAYGWVDPFIVTDSQEVTIKAFQESHDIIVIAPKWNNCLSPFDEYIILELYSPTGLNQFDTEKAYSGYYPQGPSKVAIRMWHVDARLLGFKYNGSRAITTNIEATGFDAGFITAFNNTYYDNSGDMSRITFLGKDYANHNLLQLIRNDENETYQPNSNLNSQYLFGTGKFNLNTYYRQFVYGDKGQFNNGESLNWDIDITIGKCQGEDIAKVKITKNS